MNDGEYAADAMKAMSHVVAFAQNEIGVRAEMFDIGSGDSRELNLENLDDDTAEEFL